MDLSDKRFHDLEELIKTRNSFHEWIREEKEQTQLFNQQIEKTSVPFLANVIKKEDEIIDKLKPKETPVDTSIVTDIGSLPPEYGDFYSDFKPLEVELKINSIQHPSIRPKRIVLEQYGNRFTGITLNNIPFVFYTVDGKDIIQVKDEPVNRFHLTKGLIMLLELRGMIKEAAKKVSKNDVDNYLEIMKIVGVGPTDDTYVAKVTNGEVGQGRKFGEGIDDTDIDEDVENPLELFTELRKLLAAKVSGHNNVYNSVVSILKKLMKMGEITEEKYDKILHKYF